MISLKKMNWTPTRVERFQFQREMRLEALHKKNLVKAKKIIVDSITDHILPQVSSLKTLKEMCYSLTKLFEWKNINFNMTLRKQLKNVKIQNAEQLELVKEEVVITPLNGLPGSWDSFIRGTCARRK